MKTTLTTATLALGILTSDMFRWQKEDPEHRMIVVPTNMEIRADGAAVMGAGVALIAKDRFKAYNIDREYADMLKAWATSITRDPSKVPTQLGLTQLKGQIFVASAAPLVYFPTKTFWRGSSLIELIDANLDRLRDMAKSHPAMTFGLPMLGAGNGGLPKEEISALITEKLKDLPNIQVFDYARSATTGTASSVSHPVRNEQPVAAPRPDRTPLADLELEVPSIPEDVLKLIGDKKVLVVSGHRPDKLGGYSPQVRQHTRAVAGRILDHIKPEVVVAGGALGVDRAFMEMAEERGIALILADPCQNFEARWQEQDRAKHQHLAAYADATGAHVLVTDAPYKEAGGAVCLELRNRWMVSLIEHAGEGSGFVLIHDGSAGGTANCKAAFLKKYGNTPMRARYLGNYWNAFAKSHPLPRTIAIKTEKSA